MYKPRSFEMNSHAKIFWPWFRITMSEEKNISIFAISCGFLNILIMIIHFNSKFLMTDSIVFHLKCRFRLICHFKMKSIAVILVKRLHILCDDMTRVHISYVFELNWRENEKSFVWYSYSFYFNDCMWFINRRQHWKKSYETIKTVWPKKLIK